MYFTILAAIIIALGPAKVDPASALDASFSLTMAILWTVVLIASAPLPGIVLSMTVRPEDLSEPLDRARALRRVRIGTLFCQAWILAAFAAVIYLARWPVLTERVLRLGGWVLIGRLARLVPFLAMLILAWMPLYRIDRTLRMGTWSMREYIEFHVRQYLLFILLPVCALMAVWDAMEMPWAAPLRQSGLSGIIAIASMGLVYVYAPLALRYVWKTRRLEEGHLRTRLEALAARAGVGCRDLLVWETLGGNIPNACVIGVTAPVRYIMVTDALMDTLTVEEIEGVFAHEIGHVKRHHMIYYVLFAMGLFGLVTLVGETPAFRDLSGEALGDLLSVQGLLLTAGAALYWGLGFSFVSRRMELEADLYAAALTGSTADFVNGLERISFYSGRPRTANSWRHFSIARRTDFLLACDADPARRAAFERTMKILRIAIVSLAALSLAAALTVMLWS